MNCRFRSLLASGLLSLLALSSVAQAQNSASRVEDEILVRWNTQSAPRVLAPGQDPSKWQQQSLTSRLTTSIQGARVARTFAGSGWSLVKVPSGLSAGAARAQLALLLGADNVAFNFRRYAAKTPNDSRYAEQWHWPQIKAPDAWNLSTGNSNVVVAVLDSGIDLNHADLTANLWKNPREIADNGLDDDKNGYIDDVNGFNASQPGATPQDDNGHGTHCAGLIGAVGNNKTSLAGACWNVKIMALKFLDYTGQGDDADAIACLEYAVKMKQSGVNLRVISSSWSGPEDNPALKAAFQLAEKAGILNVCAAGNGAGGIGHDTDAVPEYPASYTLGSIIAVAASNSSDARAEFSNYGAKSVDLVAPGTSILSLKRGGGELQESGTSMATPIVAGAAALLAARDSSLSATAIKDRLIKTVDPIATLKGKVVSGGRLNLSRAVANATLKISGFVFRLNGTSRVPLAGALIKINNKVLGSTDRGGKYTISDIAPGTFAVTATLNGYTFSASSVVMPRPPGQSGAPNAVIDFQAQTVPSTLYTLSGRASGANGLAQAGVSIFISGTPTAVAVTDSRGNYIIRDRAAGTYRLTASGGTDVWSPTPPTVSLPTRNTNSGAPNGIVNFSALAPDTQAPAMTITSPLNGSILPPGSGKTTGTASDVSGMSHFYFQLTRIVGFDFAFYDWTLKKWTTDANAAGVRGSKALSGRNVNWSQALPTMTEGSYSLRVWGVDVFGNESQGEADAVTSWDVKSSQSAAKTAVQTTAPSGGSS